MNNGAVKNKELEEQGKEEGNYCFEYFAHFVLRKMIDNK